MEWMELRVGGVGGSTRRGALHYHESRLSNQYSDSSELQRLMV